MSQRPRLLFVSARFLFPVDSGGKIRTTQILRGMRGGAFEIVLASPEPPGGAQRHAAELAAVCDRYVGWPEPTRGRMFGLARLRHALGRLPIPVATDISKAGRAAVARELQAQPDAIVFDFPHATVWAPAQLPAASVMFTHNVEAEIFARHAQVAPDPLRRALWRSQHRKMQRFERAALERFDTVIAVSERDAEQFRRDYGIGRVATIGTGVDLDYFTHSPPASAPHVIFSGSMDWLANIDAIEYFLDSIWPRSPAGPRCPHHHSGKGAGGGAGARARARYPGWTFTGYVDDIRPHIRSAAVYVIPLRVAGGTRLKVFEAMALGCPVVSTGIGVRGWRSKRATSICGPMRPARWPGRSSHCSATPRNASACRGPRGSRRGACVLPRDRAGLRAHLPRSARATSSGRGRAAGQRLSTPATDRLNA